MYNTWNYPRGGGFKKIVVTGSNTDTITNGAWLPLKNVEDWVCILDYAAGTVPPVIALQQATDASGTGAAALGITDIVTISATDPDAALESEMNFHENINRTTPSTSFDSTAFGGTTNKIYRVVIRVPAGTLTDGNTHVRVNTTGTATARAFQAVAISNNRSYCGNVSV